MDSHDTAHRGNESYPSWVPQNFDSTLLNVGKQHVNLFSVSKRNSKLWIRPQFRSSSCKYGWYTVKELAGVFEWNSLCNGIKTFKVSLNTNGRVYKWVSVLTSIQVAFIYAITVILWRVKKISSRKKYPHSSQVRKALLWGKSAPTWPPGSPWTLTTIKHLCPLSPWRLNYSGGKTTILNRWNMLQCFEQ